MSGSNAQLTERSNQLSAKVESLQKVQEGWKEERERLSLLVDEVQQAAKGVELRFASEMAALQVENKRLSMQKSEAEQQVNELQAVQITRLHEVEEMEGRVRRSRWRRRRRSRSR